MPLDEVLANAQAAKDKGATRFCMGAAWRSPKDHQIGPGGRNGNSRKGPWAGNMRHARHAQGAAGGITPEGRSGLLQPQSGHITRFLRGHYYNPHLSGQVGHP